MHFYSIREKHVIMDSFVCKEIQKIIFNNWKVFSEDLIFFNYFHILEYEIKQNIIEVLHWEFLIKILYELDFELNKINMDFMKKIYFFAFLMLLYNIWGGLVVIVDD